MGSLGLRLGLVGLLVVAGTISAADDRHSGQPLSLLHLVIAAARTAARRARRILRALNENTELRTAMQFAQFVASMLFVVLYVWGTYSAPAPSSFRYRLDVLLCVLFGVEYVHRLLTEESKLRMVTSFWSLCDLLAFAPPLLELALRSYLPAFSLAGVDLRWFKLLRSMRVLRIGLLASELRSLHLSTSRGGLLYVGTNFRLFQLLAAVFMLLFTTTAIVQIVERMPFHQAMYFVLITLTTVGYGDVVATTFLGKAVVLATICLGVVAIPVQAAQVYAELSARRVVLGTLPDWRTPIVLLSSRLAEVRAFSDLYSEFQAALKYSAFPRNTKMVVLCGRPSFEFRAFQELHEQRVTLMEGSAVSGRDLVAVRAEKARACLLLADRFTTDPEQEDLSILFQVWAVKSYTKTVPLYVQTVRQATVRQIAPFLDPGQDVVVSMEQTRFRLLALSAVCPGASTLIGNLLRSSNVSPPEAQQATLAGRKWLRAYVNGCAFQLWEVSVPPHLAGQRFSDVVAWLYFTSGFVLAGLIEEGDEVAVNPSRVRLALGQTVLVVGTKKSAVTRALARPYAQLPEKHLRTAERWARQWAAEEAQAAAANNPSCGCPPSGEAAAAHPHAEPHAEDAAGCVPVWLGSPDSDSVDPDTVPCVPPSVAKQLHTAEEVEAFLERYRHSSSARRQQRREGHLDDATAQRVADSAQASLWGASIDGLPEASRLSYDEREGSPGGPPPRAAGQQAQQAQQWPPGASMQDAGGGGGSGRPGSPGWGPAGLASGDRDDWWSVGSSDGSSSSSGSSFNGSSSGTSDVRDGSSLAPPAAAVVGESRGSIGGGTGGTSSSEGSWSRGSDGRPTKNSSNSSSSSSSPPRPGSTLPARPADDGLCSVDWEDEGGDPIPLQDHFIVCGNEESFCTFVSYLRQCCGPRDVPVVVLHPHRPDSLCEAEPRLGPGSPADAASLRAAGASRAKALVFLAKNARPVKSAQATGSALEQGRSSREAVLADANALLACYGVGEESGAELTHAVVELLFTTSIEFLQPGLLLKGVNLLYDESAPRSGQPRKSWLMRSWQQREAVAEGLAEWQANPYYVAGRVTVPALNDTFACQTFFNRGLLVDLLGQLSGCSDDAEGAVAAEGALLQQVPVPPGMAGHTYGECFLTLVLTRGLVCLGLYRRKSENVGTRLSYVVTSPPWHERLEATDRIFVLRPQAS
ncbi:hypothetical protein N2152v2_004409 [Parachlorella kessleri]